MIPGFVVLLAGLAVLIMTVVKLYFAGERAASQKWYGVALVGAIMTIGGLTMVLLGLRTPVEKPKVEIVKIEPKKAVDKKETLVAPAIDADSKIDNTPYMVTTAEIDIDETTASLADRLKAAYARQMLESPGGDKYTKEDIQNFRGQINYIKSGYDDMISLTITGEPPPEKRTMSKNEMWFNFLNNHGVWVSKLKREAAMKNGPGTAEIKGRIFAICDTYTNMQKVYHNAILSEDGDIDYQYIADMESRIEQLNREIAIIEKKRGFSR